MNDHTSPEPSFEIPAFDERATKRAARRALRRTAFMTVLILVVIGSVYRGATLMWSQRSYDRFQFVMGRAFEMANPAYSTFSAVGSEAGFDFGSSLIGVAAPWRADGTSAGVDYAIQRNAFGRVTSWTFLPQTRLEDVIASNGRRSLKGSGGESLIDGLPAAAVVSAVVELKEPMSEATFTAFRRRFYVCAVSTHDELARPWGDESTMMAEARFDAEERRGCGDALSAGRVGRFVSMFVSPTHHYRHFVEKADDGSHRLAWSWPTLTQLKRWADELRPSDDPNLDRFNLPSTSQIKQRADAGKIYGFVAVRLRPEHLRSLLAAPQVDDIHIGDVALDPL